MRGEDGSPEGEGRGEGNMRTVVRGKERKLEDKEKSEPELRGKDEGQGHRERGDSKVIEGQEKRRSRRRSSVVYEALKRKNFKKNE